MKRVKKLLARLRQSKKAQGQTLRYIYVTEGAHSGGRLHHHMVLGGGQQDLQLLQSLWPGHLHVESLETYGGYEPLAMYLTKEPREQGRPKPGERMWSASRNLTKPRETNQWMDEAATLTPPPGAIALHSSSPRNATGDVHYMT